MLILNENASWRRGTREMAAGFAGWAFLVQRDSQEKYNVHNLYLSNIIVPWQALGVSR